MRACPGDGDTGGAMMRMSRPQPVSFFPIIERNNQEVAYENDWQRGVCPHAESVS